MKNDNIESMLSYNKLHSGDIDELFYYRNTIDGL
jgi:hypothetical protein